ncbi:hypothetical protein Taro_053619 [Colocasia esculenta]|uniref:Uncharacterized protein n=1 Tax=Colocasia esculenta TaxID=4460 RepID=A0A843XNN0_COLES|nr:hypothetical protein [Colocasia esculenta]
MVSLSPSGLVVVGWGLLARLGSGLLMLNAMVRHVTFRSKGGTLFAATCWRQVGRRLLAQKATHLWSHSGCLVSIVPGGVSGSRAMPCVPTLVDGPSWGFRKGCRMCLCLLGLSWLQASCAVSVGGCRQCSLSPGARHLRACPRDRLLPLSGTPSPARLLEGVLRAAGMLKPRTWSRRGKQWGQQRRVVCRALLAGLSLRGGSALVRCRPASPSHCLALRWFRSRIGRSGVGPKFGRIAGVLCRHLTIGSVTHSLVPFVVAPECVVPRPRGVSEVQGGFACRPSTLWRSEVAVPVVRRCFSRGCSVSIVVTPGCSFPTSWRSGMLVFVLRLWSLLVAPVFRELRCLGGVRRGFAFALLCCSGPTMVVGRGVALVASTCV